MNNAIALYSRANDLRWSGSIPEAREYITKCIRAANRLLDTSTIENSQSIVSLLSTAVNLDDDLRSMRVSNF